MRWKSAGRSAAAAALLWALPLGACATASAPTATAEAVAQEPIVWDLTDLYPTPEAWEADRAAVEAELPDLAQYRGRLGSNAATLADAYDEVSAIYKRAVQLLVYATLKADEDTRVAENSARMQLADALTAQVSEATAWMSPEILEVGSARIESFIAREPRLAVHAFGLRKTLRGEPHTLTADEEALMSAVSLPLGGPERIYNQLSNSDIDWPRMRIDGEEVLLNSQGYTLYRQNPDRDVRKAVFDAVWTKWGQYESAFGQSLGSHVQGHVFNARARHFADAREAAMFGDALPPAIYDQLIAQTREGLPVLHRYFRLRARMLGVEDLAYYDIYPDLVSLDARYTVEDSERIALEALAPFGEEYINVLREGFAGNWMHAYAQEGKRSGAYMFGSAYDVHPYLLLNHQGEYDSLSTFVHEWGHAVHSVLANRTQPFETADYATFVAEMASTINEVLLMRYMYAHATTDDERLYYLDKELEMYRGTFFRQAMFAEFEQRIHQMAEQGEPATGEAYTQLYLELLRDYHGHDEGVMTIDEAYASEWSYIPHFYYNFYVFQYATSVTASTAFIERLTSGDASARDAVIDMLKKGGSEYPHDMFVEAGVDLTTPEPYRALTARMSEIMDEMEAILDRRGE
jgi:oligoendopeptidase F